MDNFDDNILDLIVKELYESHKIFYDKFEKVEDYITMISLSDEVEDRKSSFNLKKYTTKKVTEYDGFDSESDQIPFEQVVTFFDLNETYKLTKSSFSGYEWNYDFYVFTKNNLINLILISGFSEFFLFEKRYYCDQNENIIYQVENESNLDDTNNSTIKEVNINLGKNIRQILSDDLNKVDYILKNGN